MMAIAVPNHTNLVLPQAADSSNMDDTEINSIAAATDMFHAIATQNLDSDMPSSFLPSWEGPADRPLDMAAIDRSMTFHPSFGYTISVGTVTMDFAANKVLTIWNKRLQIFQLPKGRKNIGEGMLNGSMRETYEETGVRVRPLPLSISTRATVQDLGEVGAPSKTAKKSPQVTHGILNNEFVGAVHYPDPQSDAPAIKSMFYFAAEADSTVEPDRGTSEAYEKLETHWLPVSEIPSKLRFQAEIWVVQKALRDAIKGGYKIESLDDWRPEA